MLWRIVLFSSLFLLCTAQPHLPNDAKYFWCSTLYNPYYPLNPTNETIPLLNVTQFNPEHYPQPSFKVLPSLSLYTNNNNNGELIVFVNNTICGGPCAEVNFTVVNAQTQAKLLSQVIQTGVTNDIVFPLQGHFTINSTIILQCIVEIYGSPSTLLGQQNVTIRYHSYYANQVVIDYKSMGLLVNNKPWIPMGYYHTWTPGDLFVGIALNEARNELSTPLPYRPPIPFQQDYLNYLDLAGAMGNRVHVDLYGLSEEPDSPTKWEQLAGAIDAVKHKAGILAYYIADEPDGAGFGMDPAILEQVYTFIKDRDPYHPVTIVLNCVTSSPRYVNCADIIMADPYPIGLSQPVGCDWCEGNPMDIATRVDEVLLEINYTKPMWTVLQAFGGNHEHWNRLPSPQEIRAMSYLTFVHGARGIQYFLEGLPFSRAVWSECRKIALEIFTLSAAILSDDGQIEVDSSTSQIHATAFIETKKGIITVLVVNAINSPTSFTLTIPFLSNYPALPVKDLFETNRNFTITQGSITDLVMGFGTHAYQITFAANQFEGAAVDPNNLLRNPSFETQSNAGMADAMWPSHDTASGFGSSAIIDPNYFVHGYYSQKIINADSDSFTLSSYIIAIPGNTNFTISYYAMVANLPNKLVLHSTCFSQQFSFVFAASYQWEEVSYTFQIPSPAQCSFILDIQQGATVWIDLWQVFPTPQ